MKEIIYIEHEAGEFENGLQICIFCGEKLHEYIPGDYYSAEISSSNPNPSFTLNGCKVECKGWKGKVWRTYDLPEFERRAITMSVKPKGEHIKIVKCT